MGLLALISARQIIKTSISLHKTKSLQLKVCSLKQNQSISSEQINLDPIKTTLLKALEEKEKKLIVSTVANSFITLGCILQFTDSTQLLLGSATTPFLSDIGFSLYILGILISVGLSVSIYRNQQQYNSDLKQLEKENQLLLVCH